MKFSETSCTKLKLLMLIKKKKRLIGFLKFIPYLGNVLTDKSLKNVKKKIANCRIFEVIRIISENIEKISTLLY